MGILDLFRGRTPLKLRKKYDRLREKIDRIGNINERLAVLRLMDQIEPSIVSVEEHHMSNFERKQTMAYVESNLRKIKFMLNESKQKKREKTNYLKDAKQ